MTLRHIRIFLAICENGCNMTHAARKLYLAQPAVSLAVSELESHYGVKLFDRIARRLYLTQAGKEFWEYAVHIDSLFEGMEKRLRNWDSLGILRVGASITIGAQFMPSYVEAFCALYPGLDIRVTIGTSGQLEEKLMQGALDFALMEGVVHEPSLCSQEYLEDSLAVISSARGPFQPGQTLSVETFSQQRFLLREHGSGTREEFDSAAQAAGFSVIPAWEAMSTTALINAAVHGLGVAVVPQRMALGALRRGLAIRLEVQGMDFSRKFRIVYHKDKFLTDSAKAFMDLCRNYDLDYPAPQYSGLY